VVDVHDSDLETETGDAGGEEGVFLGRGDGAEPLEVVAGWTEDERGLEEKTRRGGAEGAAYQAERFYGGDGEVLEDFLPEFGGEDGCV